MKKFLYLLSLIFCVLFLSCNNLIDSPSGKATDSPSKNGFSISGLVSPYDFADTTPAKSAFPTVPSNTDTLYYTVTATLGSTSVSENVQGTSGAQFNLKLPSSGDWSVTATCFGTDSSRTTVVYKTVKPQVISVTNASPSKFANLTLKPLMTTGKTGTLNLEIDGTGLDSSFHPSTIKIECISGNLPDMEDRISASFDIPTKKYTLKTKDGKALPSGSYTFNINFITDANNLYFYSVTETVNIYDGLETNRWVKNGNEEYVTAAGEFVLTDAIVNKFQQESIYVDSSALSNDASGSWLDPYKSLDAAIARLGTGSSVKTIFVSGNHTTNKNLNFSNGGNCDHDLTIKKNPRATSKPVITTTSSSSFIVGGPHKIVLENIDFTGCGNDDGASPTGTNSDPTTKAGAFLYFQSSTGSAEITNCKISDYYSDKGGAICAGAYSTTTLTNVDITRCKATKGGAIYTYGNLTYVSGNITDCSATNNGGAIYHESGNLTIEEGVCIGKRNATAIADITNSDEHKYSNYASNYGGGIYSEGGTLSLKGLISYNAAERNGGGLYLSKIGNTLTYNPTDEIEVSYNCAGTTGGGIIYAGLRKNNYTYNIYEKIHHNQAKTGGGLCISTQTNGSTFYIFSPVYNNKAYAETTEDDSFGSGGGISILSDYNNTFNINRDITQNTASNLGGGIFVAGTADTEVHISGKLSGNAVSGSNPILSHGIYVRCGKLCLNSDSEISSGQDMYVYNSTSRIEIQATPSKLGNIKLYLNTNPGDNGFKSGDEIFTGTTEENLRAGLSKITPSDPDSFSFIQYGTRAFLSRNVYIAGSDSTKLPHGVNEALSENPDRGKKTAPFASLSYASRQFNHNDFITYYIEGTTVEGSTTAEENPCIFMGNIASPKTITVRGYEGGKRATLKGISENAGFGTQYSTFFYNVAGNLTISDIDIDGTGSKYSSAVITGDPTLIDLISPPVTDIYDVNIKNFTFVASGTDPETGVILCNSDSAVINIKGGSIKDCDRTGGAILARQGNVHISLHEISGCTNAKNGEDAVVSSGAFTFLTFLGYLHLENTKISGTDSTKAVVKVYGSPINVGGDTTIENGYVYLENNANITLTSNITSDICAHIRSSDPNTYPTVLLVDTNYTRAEQEELINTNYQKFIYDGTYELKPVITSSVYTYLYAVSYVDGSNGKTGVDGGTGAKDNPFKTVSEAVDELRTQLNSGTNKNAIVYVAGTTEESSVINTEDVSVSLSTLTIKQWSGKTKAVIKRGATHTDSIIKVSSNSILTLEDIEINGNNAVLSDINGAGLSIQGNSATATLTNVKIYGCKVRQDTTPLNVNTNYGQGGAIFAKGNLASLYLKGNTVIGSDITGALSEENSSNCAKEGGAIYFQTITTRALEIEDTVIIKGNYAVSNGGAIYMRQQNLSANIGGSIKNNAAGTAGGAIYNYGCTSVINGTISGNTSPSGSIYAADSAKIQLNAKSNIGPDDEVVLFRDPSSSLYGQIYIGGALTAQSNLIKVSCENPDTSTFYVTGPNALVTRNGIPKLTYNGIFRFITSGDNLGKIEVAPVYVAGEGSGMTGNDLNPGTENAPLATVRAAVMKCSAYGGTIYVAGTTTEDMLIPFSSQSSPKTFEIKQWPSKKAAVIKRGTTTSCLIDIQSGNIVTFKDLDIDGNNVSATYGSGPAGINCNAGATGSLTLENVNILNMIRSAVTNPLGGAIYTSGTPFTMKGGSIKNCMIRSDTGPAGKGGAIYSSGNKPVVLENVTFSGNKAKTGNGIYLSSGNVQIKGSTKFGKVTDDLNDIYLNNISKIVIDGDLSADTVAVISLPMGDNGLTTRTEKTILISSEANGVKNNYQKFSINSTNYSLVEDGTIIRSVNDFSELTGISKALVQLEDDTTLTYSDFESIKTKDILVKTNGNQLTIQASDTLLTGKLKIDAGDADGNKGIVKFLSGGGATLSGPAIDASGSNAEFEITNANVQISVSYGETYEGAFKISDGAAVTFENVDFTDLRFSAPTVKYGLFNIDSGNLTYKGGSITNVSGGGYGGTALLVYGSGSAKIELSDLSISDISNPSQSTLICAEDNTELVMDAVEITGFSVLSSNSEKSIIRCDSGNTNNKLSLINIHDNDFVSDTSNRDPIAPGIAIKIGTGGYLSIEDSYIQNNYGFYQGCISVAGELIFNNSFVLNNTTSCTIDQFQERSVNGNAFYVDSSGSLKLKGSSNICDNKMSIEGERTRSPKVHGPAIYINGGEVTKEESVIMTGNKNTNEGMPDNCQVYCVSGTYNGTSYSFTGVPGTEW